MPTKEELEERLITVLNLFGDENQTETNDNKTKQNQSKGGDEK